MNQSFFIISFRYIALVLTLALPQLSWSDEPFLIGEPPVRLTPEDTNELFYNDENFGQAVAVDGDVIVVGAPRDKEKGQFSAGAAFIYQYNSENDNWEFRKKILGSDIADNSEFGTAVAISGDTIFVGAPFRPINNAPWGEVYVFERNQGGTDNWGETLKLTPYFDDVQDAMNDSQTGFGSALDVEGDTLIIGAPFDDINNIVSRGSVSIRNRETTNDNVDDWGEVAKRTILPIGANFFGTSVSLSGDLLAVGASNVNSKGKVYIYDRNTNWGYVTDIENDNGQNLDRFGFSVALDGNVLAVGSPGDNGNQTDAGRVFIYYRDNGGNNQWGLETDFAGFDQQGADFGDALTLIGGRLIAGVSGADLNVDDMPGVESNVGLGLTFQQHAGGNLNSWSTENILLADDFADNESSEDDSFGYAIAASADYLVVGSINNDSDANDGIDSPGSVYVYRIKSELFSDGFEQ